MKVNYLEDSGTFISVEDALRLVTWCTSADHPMNSADKLTFTREQNEQALREAHEHAKITLRDAASMREKNPSKNLDSTRRRVTAEIKSSGLGAVCKNLWISDEDVQRFAELRFVPPHFVDHRPQHYGIRSYDVENELGCTIGGAAWTLAYKYGISEGAIQARIFEAAWQGKLQVKDPQTGIPYVPNERSYRYERIDSYELNQWLEASGVPYRLGNDAEEQTATSASTGPRDIDRREVMRIFSVDARATQNRMFWNHKLGDPPRWLEGARTVRGKPGRSSRWAPLLVAHALLHRKKMTIQQLDSAIRKYLPDLLEEWEESTGDLR